MSQQEQELDRLRQALAALQRENQQLKAAAGLPLTRLVNGHKNGHPLPQDPALKALARQVEALHKLRVQSENQLSALKKAEQALMALLPALEVEWRGLQQQSQLLQQQVGETENTYASVVEKLERQLKDLRFDMKSEMQQQRQAHEAAKLKLHRRLASLETELETTRAALAQAQEARQANEPPQRPHPFSDLSIFEA
jgi:hypothetical protein